MHYWEIPQIYHTFALFDVPQIGNLMITCVPFVKILSSLFSPSFPALFLGGSIGRSNPIIRGAKPNLDPLEEWSNGCISRVDPWKNGWKWKFLMEKMSRCILEFWNYPPTQDASHLLHYSIFRIGNPELYLKFVTVTGWRVDRRYISRVDPWEN